MNRDMLYLCTTLVAGIAKHRNAMYSEKELRRPFEVLGRSDMDAFNSVRRSVVIQLKNNSYPNERER